MEKPNIVDIKTKTIIDPTKLFGKDANRLLKACNIAFENGLLSNQYKGCYRSFSHPRLEDVRKKFNSAEGENLAVAYKIALAEWESANPKEATKERKSRENWEYNRDKQFRIIYGIAKRHGLYIRWLGTQFCDQWTIYKRNEPIARIYCV